MLPYIETPGEIKIVPLESLTFDDEFVRRQLSEVAHRWPPLKDIPIGQTSLQKRIRGKKDQCINVFRKHYCVSRIKNLPPHISEILGLLEISLEILGKVLVLEKAIPDIERLIEADWIAHIELEKEQRYRDHITHPVRVTAIGWWLLHRNKGTLLKHLAEYYESNTSEYCNRYNIHDQINVWWDKKANSLSAMIKDTIEDSPPDHLLPWMALLEYAWLISGLLHDSAYPLEHHFRSCKRLKKRFGQTMPFLNHIVGNFNSRISLNNQLDFLRDSWFFSNINNFEARVSDCFEDCDAKHIVQNESGKHPHAALGALHHLSSIKKDIHTVQGLVSQMACRAITTHHDIKDDRSNHKDLDIQNDGLALLLFISDVLQAWKRPFIHRIGIPFAPDSGKDEQRISRLYECKEIELNPDGMRYRAIFKMNEDRIELRILKSEPYKWELEKFQKPNRIIEHYLQENPDYPKIILSQLCCIHPPEFLTFMQKKKGTRV